jgi:CRISPR/Cas system CSM-associated protein Csm3 (group 7 of RAMP superfamily)
MLFRLTIKLKVKAPLITKSSEIGALGIDAAMAKNADDKYSFPRRLIKGCLRQALTELKEADITFKPDIETLFGKESAYEAGASSSVEPNRGLLVFDDFVAVEKENKETLFRISIERERRAAQQGAYQVIESPFAVGEEVEFAGCIRYFAKDQKEADEIKGHIELGLKWITHLGALENVGFGRLMSVEVNPSEPEEDGPTIATAPSTEALDLIISPQAPFCLARKQTNQNIFESDTVISGGALKGALASTWLKTLGAAEGAIEENTDPTRRELGRNFSRLRFTHAFPALKETNKRPTMYPYSLVKIKDDNKERIYDVARCETPVLIKRHNGELIAPEFFMDWKESDDVWNYVWVGFGWATPKTKLEIHTAIKDNSAKEGQLYAYELIVPKDKDDESKEIEWYARVDLSDVPKSERREVADQLCGLLAAFGLQGFGKTKATATVKVKKQDTIKPFKESDESELIDGYWVITLQTPALLCDPARLDEMSGKDELRDAYQEVWADVSKDDGGEATLELVRYFASQSLAGGKYLHKRFQSSSPYNPYLLTEAGSVFVLRAVKGKEIDAGNLVREWARKGLPLPLWAKARYARNSDKDDGDDWTNCPYIRQNGYGEIAVNLTTHKEKYEANVYERIQPIETEKDGSLKDVPSIVRLTPQPSTSKDAKTPRKFLSRWLIEGVLTTRTTLHIGNGDTTTRAKLTNTKTGKPVDIASVIVDKDERAYLPATTIKGNLREWARACGMKGIEIFFGSDKGVDKEKLQAGKVQFHDAYATAEQVSEFAEKSEPPYWCNKRLTGVASAVALDRRRRTASDQKLFHYEYVPPGISFTLVLSGNDYDDSVGTSGDAGLVELLALLEGFNDNNGVTLGSETSDTGEEGWGRFTWKLKSVKLLGKTKLKEEWIDKDRDGVGCGIAEKFSVERKDDLVAQVAERVAQLKTASIPRHHIALNVRLNVRDNFIVNDPSTSGKDPLPNHTPLRDINGKPLLPRRSIKGAVRSQAEKIIRTMGGYACYPDDQAKACQPVRTIKEAQANLCLACQLFGASGWRSPFQCTPFLGAKKLEPQKQEFVGIDRFTGGSADARKFNAESFQKPATEELTLTGIFSLDLKAVAELYKDNKNIRGSWAVGLLALTMRDLAEGDIRIGFGAAKGYGAVEAMIEELNLLSLETLPESLRAVFDEEFLSDRKEIKSHDELVNSLSRTILEMCLSELPQAIATGKKGEE